MTAPRRPGETELPPTMPSVLLVNYWDRAGGAGRATQRLLQGLLEQRVRAHLMAVQATSGDPSVQGPVGHLDRLGGEVRRVLDRIPLLVAASGRRPMFSTAWAPSGLRRRIAAASPDLVHLHWINGGMLRLESLARLGAPVVWTMHDMWPFTGGCHYDEGCGRFVERCGRCPVLGSAREWDLSRWIWRRKQRAWRGLPITVVAPSHWLAACARSSPLFRDFDVEVIPNGLDLEVFRPRPPEAARDLLGLPEDRTYLLFAAAEPEEARKGWHLLQPALARLASASPAGRLALLVAGGHRSRWPGGVDLETHFLGELRDELTMAIALAAADVVLVPSTQDNLPNVAVEAAACGRPIVAFAAGGLPDIVAHRESGYLGRPLDSEDLATGVGWVIGSEERRQGLGQEARRKAEQTFDIRMVARRHLDLYVRVLDSRRPGAGAV